MIPTHCSSSDYKQRIKQEDVANAQCRKVKSKLEVDKVAV